MELAKTEVLAAELLSGEQTEPMVRELAVLELALVGGGMGDVSLG